MDYFKHYATASSSKLINYLFDEFGHSGYAYWFLLLELCAEHWDGNSAPKFAFHTRIVRQKLRISQAKLELFLGKCSGFSNLLFSFSGSELHLEIPKLMEVKTSRSVIKSNKKQLTVYIEEDKDKEEEEEADIVFSIDSIIQQWNDFAQLHGFESNPLVGDRQLVSDANFTLRQLAKQGKNFIDYLAKIEASKAFLKRKTGAAVSLRWVMNERNFHKIMGGSFMDNNSKSSNQEYINSIKLSE